MPDKITPAEESILDKVMAACCSALPNCTRAVHLAETACERELSLRESIQLKYDRRLCPFCGCAAGKFASVEHRMQEARQQRLSGQSPSGH